MTSRYRRHPEYGSFGLVEALFGLLLMSVVVAGAIFTTNSFAGMTQGASQGSTRAAALNSEIDLAATAAYNPATLNALNGKASVALNAVALPAMTPFPGASALPTPVATSAYILNSPVYNATTKTLTGTVTGNGANFPVSISQRTFGKSNCDSRLQGQTDGSVNGSPTIVSTPVPGC